MDSDLRKQLKELENGLNSVLGRTPIVLATIETLNGCVQELQSRIEVALQLYSTKFEPNDRDLAILEKCLSDLHGAYDEVFLCAPVLEKRINIFLEKHNKL